ncbi:MAG: ABC transporter substrate-binding protein [Nitrospinota bacterium]
MKGKILAISSIFLALALVLAYGGEAAEEVRLGALYPLSGKAARSGQETVEAIKLAVDVINGKHDIDLPLARTAGLPNLGGAKVRLILEDHAASPEKGRAIAERFITSEKVHVLQGAFHSAVAAPSSHVAEKYGIPYVTGESEDPRLTARGFKTFFSVTPTTDNIVQDFFAFLEGITKKKGLSVKKIAVIHANDLWGTGLAIAAKKYYKQHGMKIVADIGYSPALPDLKSEVLQLKKAAPDVVFQASFDNDAILSVKSYRALRFSPMAVIAMGASFSSPNFIGALGPDADYNFSHTKFHASLVKTRKAARAISDLFQKRTGKPIWGTPARAFTATIVIAEAVNRAGSLEPGAIIKALRETDLKAGDTIMPYRGVKFNEKGQNVRAQGLITQIRGGKHYVVWPFEFAQREAVFPMPPWSER